jgi:hypothetical protein
VKLTTRLDGLDGLRRSLDCVADAQALRGELTAAAEELRDAARAELNGTAPGDDGLSHSLTIGHAGGGKAATVSTPLDHGWHREFGSLGHPPRPWLAPALAEARPGILARLRGWLAHTP